ncbi:MAG: hypothetical protein ACI4PO_08830, partial [Faecousia sp.]
TFSSFLPLFTHLIARLSHQKALASASAFSCFAYRINTQAPQIMKDVGAWVFILHQRRLPRKGRAAGI